MVKISKNNMGSEKFYQACLLVAWDCSELTGLAVWAREDLEGEGMPISFVSSKAASVSEYSSTDSVAHSFLWLVICSRMPKM